MTKKKKTEDSIEGTEDRTRWTEDKESEGATARVAAGNVNDRVLNNGQIGIEAIIKSVNTNQKGTVIALAGCILATPEERLMLEDLVQEKDEVIVTIRPRQPKMIY